MTKQAEIKKLEKKLQQVRNGKWSEDAEHIHKLETRLEELREEVAKDGIPNGRY